MYSHGANYQSPMQRGDRMSDLISRKAILKNIEKIRQGVQMMDDTHRASIIMNGMYLCEKAVRNQPSAQPEIIRCKDCIDYQTDWTPESVQDMYYCATMDRMMPEDAYCSFAERRTE